MVKSWWLVLEHFWKNTMPWCGSAARISTVTKILLTLNSLNPGEFELNFRYVIFKRISVIDGLNISCEIALIWTSLDFTDDQSTLVQVMAWCRQAPSHYLSQCWPRSLLPYGVTRPHWVKLILDWPKITSHIHTQLKWLLRKNNKNICHRKLAHKTGS